MNHKKSMRIFWLSLFLLLISGVIIIAAVQLRAHKKAKTGPDNVAQQETSPGKEETEPDTGSATIPSAPGDSPAKGQVQPGDQSLQQTNGGAAPYLYELKIRNGHLEVYYYHTNRLFLYTGIPYEMLTTEQRLDLQRGKYFIDEQELYGYLESCTS